MNTTSYKHVKYSNGQINTLSLPLWTLRESGLGQLVPCVRLSGLEECIVGERQAQARDERIVNGHVEQSERRNWRNGRLNGDGL